MRNAVRYKVTVVATVVTQESDNGATWGIVDHVNSGEVTKSGDPLLKPKYGFLPEAVRTRQQDVQIFEQSVEAPVDLVKLVQVVNGLL